MVLEIKDNSGIDIILGVFFFVRELFFRGIEVILVCNLGFVLNDVIYSEFFIVVECIVGMDFVVYFVFWEERLLLV